MLAQKLLLCVGIITLTCSALAQNSVDSVQHIDLVTVTAQQTRQVIPSQKLSSKELQALNSYSIADAIRYFSGVQLKDYGGVGGLKTIDVRSMGSNHLGVFYDGIQLGNAQNGQIDLGKYSLDNIEEIQLYNGQKSEIFQPAKDFSTASAVYLKTRVPQFDTTKNYNLRAFARFGSFDLYNPSVLWEQKLSKRVSLSLNGEYVQASGRYPFRYRKVFPDGTVAWDTTAIRKNGDIESWRFEGALFGHTKRNAHWQGKFYMYDSEKGIPGAIVNNVWKQSQRQWDKNAFVQFSYKQPTTFIKKHSMLANVKYANDKMRYLNPDTTLMYINNSFTQQELYFSMANKYSINKYLDVNIGTDYQWNTLYSNMKNFVTPTRNTVLVAVAGALEIWKIKSQISFLETLVYESHAESKQEHTPAIFLSYKPWDVKNFHLRAFYKRIFRMPTFNDLYYTDIGNIYLKPEYTNQYNIGAYYSKPLNTTIVSNYSVQIDAYYNEVTDKIVAIPKGNGQYRWMMMNLGYVKIHGADVSGKLHWTLQKVKLQTSLQYTYQQARDFTNPQSTWHKGQIAYIPVHSGSAILNGQWKTWDMNYSFVYVGERYHNSANILANYEQPWYTHDFSIGKNVQLPARKKNNSPTSSLKISMEVNNLLNQYYDVILNYPMPGRNYKIILKLEI